jgi:hypothetical protein
MIRPRWSSRAGRGGSLNRENTGRELKDMITDLLSGPSLPGAACIEVDPEVWYPSKGDSTSSRTARTICRGGTLHGKRIPPCPVRTACLARALDTSAELTHYGTWAGYTAKTLSRMRHIRAAIRRASCPPLADAHDKAA